MRGRLPLLVILGSTLGFLASLYLSWETAAAGSLFVERRLTGWSNGELPAVLSLLVVSACIAGLFRSTLAERLPVGRLTLALGYLALAGLAAARASARKEVSQHGYLLSFVRAPQKLPYHYGVGAWLGLGCGLAMIAGAITLRRRELARRPSWTLLPAAGLLASLTAIPWISYRYDLRQDHISFTTLAIGTSAGVLAAVAACMSLNGRGASPRGRFLWSGAALVFTGAAWSEGLSSPLTSFRLGAWLGLGFAVALAASGVMEISTHWTLRHPTRWHAVLSMATAALLIVALYLPWQDTCFPVNRHLGTLSGQCISEAGWGFSFGTVVGALLVALVVGLILRVARFPVLELVGAVALLVATLGADANPAGEMHFAFGAYIGFAGAGLLLAFAITGVGRHAQAHRKRVIQLLPIVSALTCLAIVVVPLWHVLPDGMEGRFYITFARSSWLTVALVVLAAWLLGLWVRRGPGSSQSELLVLIPTAMLAVLTLGLTAGFHLFTWGDGIEIGLSLLLAIFGWTEHHGGLERLRIPEAIWRIDRLPPVED